MDEIMDANLSATEEQPDVDDVPVDVSANMPEDDSDFGTILVDYLNSHGDEAETQTPDAAVSVSSPANSDGEAATPSDASASDAPPTTGTAESVTNPAPTTDRDSGVAEQAPQAGDVPPPPASDVKQETKEAAPSTIKLRVNHEDIELPMAEAIERLQRSIVQETKAKQDIYRNTYQELLKQDYPEALARAGAKEAAGGVYPLEDTPEEPVTTRPPDDVRDQVAQIRAVYPDMREMPQEVMDRSVREGIPLFSAYVQYRSQADAKAAQARIAALEAENRTLKQNQTNALKAPVKPVSEGGATQEAKAGSFEDLLLKGFDSKSSVF